MDGLIGRYIKHFNKGKLKPICQVSAFHLIPDYESDTLVPVGISLIETKAG